MKLYIAYKDASTLMEGTFEDCLGVFDSREKAWAYLSTTSDFKNSNLTRDGEGRVYHFDGELSYHWHVKEVTLNKGKSYK